MLVNRKQRRAAPKLKVHMETAADLLTSGFRLHQSGRLTEAEACYRRVLSTHPNHPDALNLLGVVTHQTGRHDLAVEMLHRAIRQNGQNPGYFSNLGNVLYSQGKLDEAVAAYRHAIRLKPEFADAHSNLGVALKERGKFEEAIAAYRQAIKIDPMMAEAHINLGAALNEHDKHDEAVFTLRRAIRLKPDSAKAYYNLGVSLSKGGRLDEAIAAYHKAVSLKADFAEAHYNLGVALKEIGELGESRKALERSIELAPMSTVSYRVLSDAKRFTSSDPHLATMEKLARNIGSLSSEARIDLHFALAKAYDDVGDYEASFNQLLEGNSLKRQQITYDEVGAHSLFGHIQRAFTLERMRHNQGLGDPSNLPVFIIGMPRSGTTLIEQILASHPKVFGAGELGCLANEVARLLSSLGRAAVFPEAVFDIGTEKLRELGSSYVAAVRDLAATAERITDKMPLNFRFAGLIQLALPNARIIHVRRDPLDTCLSCFSKLFAEDQPYSYDLGELGRFYLAYAGLMDHWRRVLPPGVMLEIHYEDLITNVEIEARRAISHCGLEWSDVCLSFHENKRPVRTASAIQVRQPIYQNSVGRWRRYERQLRPLIDVLNANFQSG